MRHLFNAETVLTAAKGAVGMGATTGGFYVSTLPKIEAWLRFVSLVIGIAVGVASLISIIRNKKVKKTKLLPALAFLALATSSAMAAETVNAAATGASFDASTILSLVAGVVIVARIVVKLTPTPKDDSSLEKIVTFLKHIGLHIEKK